MNVGNKLQSAVVDIALQCYYSLQKEFLSALLTAHSTKCSVLTTCIIENIANST